MPEKCLCMTSCLSACQRKLFSLHGSLGLEDAPDSGWFCSRRFCLLPDAQGPCPHPSPLSFLLCPHVFPAALTWLSVPGCCWVLCGPGEGLGTRNVGPVLLMPSHLHSRVTWNQALIAEPTSQFFPGKLIPASDSHLRLNEIP